MTLPYQWLSANEQFRSATDLHGSDVTIRSNVQTGMDGIPVQLIIDGGTSKETNENDNVIVNDLQEDNKVKTDTSDPENDSEKTSVGSTVASSESYRHSTQSKEITMKNLGKYLPSKPTVSTENHVDVEPVSDIIAIDPTEALPGEPVEVIAPELMPESVEAAGVLPEVIDPTPMEPLSEDIAEAEVMSEIIEEQGDQLLVGTIAMEQYSKLLSSAGSNLSAQAAAFMRVGVDFIQRGEKTGLKASLEQYGAGGMRSAMSRVTVSQEDLKETLSNAGAKFMEWLRKQMARAKALWAKILAMFNKDKEKVTYLLAASKAMESGNTAPLKALPAPSGLRTVKAVDFMEQKKQEPKAPETIKVGAFGRALFYGNGTTFRGDLSNLERVVKQEIPKLLSSAKAMIDGGPGILTKMASTGSEEELRDMWSDYVKSHFGGQAVKLEIFPGAVWERTNEGVIVMHPSDHDTESSEKVEVRPPSLQELEKMLGQMNKIIPEQDELGAKLAEFLEYGSSDSVTKAQGDALAKLSKEQSSWYWKCFTEETGLSKMVDEITHLSKACAEVRKRSLTFADMVLWAYADVNENISQEDYMALGGPTQPGFGDRVMAGARTVGSEAAKRFRQLMAWFRRIWEQAMARAANLWSMMFGTGKKTQLLLLANNVVPETVGGVPGSADPSVFAGSRMKSAGAARLLLTHQPGTAPVSAPVPDTDAHGTNIPAGMVALPEVSMLMVNNVVAMEPAWEEQALRWLTGTFIPAQQKAVNDLTSYVGSVDWNTSPDWQPKVIAAIAAMYTGLPAQGIPGNVTMGTKENGAPSFIKPSSYEPVQVKVVKKRPLDQALARQAKVLKGLEPLRDTYGRIKAIRDRFDAAVEKRSGSLDEVGSTQLEAFYTMVNNSITKSMMPVIVKHIADTCEARVVVADAMIAARAAGK